MHSHFYTQFQVMRCHYENDVCPPVRSVLDPFPTVHEATVHRPAVGSPLSLHCSVPECYPPGNVYWGENRNGPKLRPIVTTERIALDYEGNSITTHLHRVSKNVPP